MEIIHKNGNSKNISILTLNPEGVFNVAFIIFLVYVPLVGMPM